VARKHKHEEHANHERWVISYADMVTLLFALFVVLYALGEVQLRKLKELKKSVQFAFHFEGSGKTKDEGIFDKGEAGGSLQMPAPLLTAQKKEMQEFLLETLPREFEEKTGKSLDIVQTDDTVAFSAPLSAFFPKGQVYLRPSVNTWLQDVVKGAYSFTSRIRVRIEAPNVRIGTAQDGTAVNSNKQCLQRLATLQGFLRLSALDEDVQLEFRYADAHKLGPIGPGGWEDQAMLRLAFTNMADDLEGSRK
jgi:chemotaxis protein MotB